MNVATNMHKVDCFGVRNDSMLALINTHASYGPHMKHEFESDAVLATLFLRILKLSVSIKELH